MNCPACDAEVLRESLFCHKCGHRLSPQDPHSEQIQSGIDEASSKFMEKIKNAVQPNMGDEVEKELWQGGYSPKAMIGAWCLSAAISIVLLIIGILWVRQAWYWVFLLLAAVAPWIYNIARLSYRRLSVRYLLTSQRFIHESGVFRRISDRIEVLDIDDITYEQGPVERLVGVGSIKIVSSDRTHPELILHGIENVRAISNLIDDTRRTDRRRRGLHIESI